MIINYIIKKDDVERIYLGIKEKIDEKSIRAMNKVAKALFNETLIADDTDKMIKDFKELLKKKIEEIRNIENEYTQGNYPGKDILEEGRKLLEKLERIKDSREVFNEVLGHADDYEDFSEDVEPIEKFFKGEQKNIWDNSIKLSKIYGNSKCFAHSECDAIIKDNAKVKATPEITANNVDANLIHEAAIGKIAGEQLTKLMTLGLSEKEAEEQIIQGFLK